MYVFGCIVVAKVLTKVSAESQELVCSIVFCLFLCLINEDYNTNSIIPSRDLGWDLGNDSRNIPKESQKESSIDSCMFWLYGSYQGLSRGLYRESSVIIRSISCLIIFILDKWRLNIIIVYSPAETSAETSAKTLAKTLEIHGLCPGYRKPAGAYAPDGFDIPKQQTQKESSIDGCMFWLYGSCQGLCREYYM